MEKVYASYDKRINPYGHRYLNSLFEGAESVEQRLKSEKNIDNTPERTIDECLTIKDTKDLKKRIGSFTFKLNEAGETEKAFNVWVKNIHRTEKTMTQLENQYALLDASIYLFNDKKTDEALEILEKTFARVDLDNDENYKCDFIEEAALNLDVRNSEILDMILKHTHEISCHSIKATLLSKLAGHMQAISMFETAKKVWLDALAIIDDGLLHSDMSETMKSILQHIRSHEVKEIEILKKVLEISGKIIKKWDNPGPFIDTLKILLSANPGEADLWDEALSISKTMTENENLVTVYSHIATHLAITGSQAGAKNYLKRVVLLAEGLNLSYYFKDEYLKEVAIICGEIGFLEEGLIIGKKIKTEDMKAEVYSFIASKMSQNGEEKESDVVLKQAFEIVSTGNSKHYSLAPIVFWMGQNRDREKTSQIMGSVFNIIEGIPEVSDKLWSIREIIERMVWAKNNASELIFDMIKEKISELIDELEEKPGDDISQYLISDFGFCLGNADVLDPGPWQKIIRVSEKINRDLDRSKALSAIARFLYNTGVSDENTILMLEKAAEELNSPESISGLYYTISMLYNTAGNINGAMRTIERINKKETRLSAATWIIMGIIRAEKIDKESENAVKLIMMLRDYPKYFSKNLFPFLLDYYAPKTSKEIEKLILFLLGTYQQW
ncbi:hypothetical protein ES705_26631 [subsurface metagenome]